MFQTSREFAAYSPEIEKYENVRSSDVKRDQTIETVTQTITKISLSCKKRTFCVVYRKLHENPWAQLPALLMSLTGAPPVEPHPVVGVGC